MIKTNYELLKETFNEINEVYGYVLFIIEEKDNLSIRYEDEEIVKISKEAVEAYDEPIKVIIDYFYENNEKAKSKETDKSLDKILTRNFKKVLKSDDKKEIFSLIDLCKVVKREKDSLKDNLKWTRDIARSLYLARDLFVEKFDDEVI
ncbi:MAG: hypothetical protein E6300_16845 [Clostridium sp.]|uniref:hypothetical protein n=1 Tax=Clostridium sp. TaxID=1506 RepID=UPI00291488A2|nr:hypothetical protein [Clostridium sp.]MDU7150145.1 hypothetical protein [Clostridium sp.]MDU7243354.1 hypothetical protein [Clostridium sp.]